MKTDNSLLNNYEGEKWYEETWFDKEEHDLYPIDRDKIQVTVNNVVIFSIVQYILRWDIELQPNFQRSYVRDDKKAENFIDSIRNWLPIPQLFLLTKKDGNQFVIDGQQRLTSLIRFILNEDDLKRVLPDVTFREAHNVDSLTLKVSKSIFTGDQRDRDVKVVFSDLDKEIQRKFEWESLIIAQIKPTYSLFQGREEELEELSKEIFYRLNTWWEKLTSQEIRYSLYHKKFMRELKKISLSKAWRNLIPTWIQKFKNDPSLLTEMLLRGFALLDVYAKNSEKDSIGMLTKKNNEDKFIYEPPFNLFLDKYASLTEDFNDTYIEDRISILNNLLEHLNQIVFDQSLLKHQKIDNQINWKSRSNSFNVKYIDTLFVGLLNLFRYIKKIDLDVLKQKIGEFKGNSDFIENHISKSWSWGIKYVQDRVTQSIKFFESLVK